MGQTQSFPVSTLICCRTVSLVEAPEHYRPTSMTPWVHLSSDIYYACVSSTTKAVVIPQGVSVRAAGEGVEEKRRIDCCSDIRVMMLRAVATLMASYILPLWSGESKTKAMAAWTATGLLGRVCMVAGRSSGARMLIC